MAGSHDVQAVSPGKPGKRKNLKGQVAINIAQEPPGPLVPADQALDKALQLDTAIKSRRPDGWRGVVAKEQMVKQAMYEVLKDIQEVDRLFPIVFAQQDY